MLADPGWPGFRAIKWVCHRCCWFIYKRNALFPVSAHFPSVLWHCWLGDRKDIRPVKCWVLLVGGDNVTVALLSSCHHSPPPSSLAPIKCRMETFWYWLGKWPLNRGGELEANCNSCKDDGWYHTLSCDLQTLPTAEGDCDRWHSGDEVLWSDEATAKSGTYIYLLCYSTAATLQSAIKPQANMLQVMQVHQFPFSALTLLVGWQEGHPVCKRAGCWFVGDDDFTVLELFTSYYSSSCHRHLRHTQGQFSAAVTHWSRSTQLHYIEPG